MTFKTSKPMQLAKEKLLCSITKITFDRPINEVPDWDDRMRSVKWIDVSPSSADSNVGDQQRPARKKVVEADAEPAHQRIEEQTRLLDIYISAVADHCRYKCSEFEVRYLDTAMLQTRVHEYVLTLRRTLAYRSLLSLRSESPSPIVARCHFSTHGKSTWRTTNGRSLR